MVDVVFLACGAATSRNQSDGAVEPIFINSVICVLFLEIYWLRRRRSQRIHTSYTSSTNLLLFSFDCDRSDSSCCRCIQFTFRFWCSSFNLIPTEFVGIAHIACAAMHFVVRSLRFFHCLMIPFCEYLNLHTFAHWICWTIFFIEIVYRYTFLWSHAYWSLRPTYNGHLWNASNQ